MQLKDFDYNLPKELIAQKPAKPRDHSRLLILARETGKIEHKRFYNIVDCLKSGDVLVLNNTKVFPARLLGEKETTGGKMEVFLLKKNQPPLNLPLSKGENKEGVWECLLGGRGGKVRLKIIFEHGLIGEVLKDNNTSASLSAGISTALNTGASASLSTGTWQIKFNKSGDSLMKIINKIGHVPLPPYIKSESARDKKTYQTIYADQKKVGSVAAPTAGLHFTPELIRKIKNKGVQIEYITLHVGLGTFAPVKIEDISKHKMHSELAEADAKTIARLYSAKHEGRKIIAVGTTTARTLEAIVSEFPISNFQFPNNFQLSMTKFLKQFSNYNKFVDIFIFPGYKFKIVDAMITNFHLPKSTLLMLVSAFAKASADKSDLDGKNKIDKAYLEAIEKKYRFFSYGDAMFIS